MIERWRPVIGFEDTHEVSDHGAIRSKPRKDRLARDIRGGILKPHVNAAGYRSVLLHIGAGKHPRKLIHRAVLEAFVGPAPDGTEGCHRDNDKANNHVSNLRWDTHSANQLDQVRHGVHANAAKVTCPRGHPLSEPNLVAHKARKGSRVCRACDAAASYAHRRRIPLTQAIADHYYQRVVAGDLRPIRRRKDDS